MELLEFGIREHFVPLFDDRFEFFGDDRRCYLTDRFHRQGRPWTRGERAFEELREAAFKSSVARGFEGFLEGLEGGAPVFFNPILEGLFLLRWETFDPRFESG